MKKILTLFTALILFGSMTVVQADTWTVAGDNTTILGSGTWNTENTDNDMINVSGSNWYLLKANKTLTGGTLKYKVAKDHAWTTAYPGSDRSFTLTAGTYDVLFKFDSSSHDVSEAKVTTWTVAGTQTVWGSNWNTEDTENDMTRSGDNWTFTKSHVLLATGNTYECKVAANHAWTYAFPGENKTFSVTEDGYYDVTVDFNTSTLEVTVTTTFKEHAVPPTPVITLHSNITNPSWSTSAAFVSTDGDVTASLTLTGVAKGNYEFGIEKDGTWTSNGSAFTRTNFSHEIVTGSGNCTFNADRNGNYTFTWRFSNNTLEIGYPAIPAQSVTITGLASQILKGTAVTFTASSSGIDDPGYRFYVKEKNGEYGSAVTSYTFNAVGEYKVKVEALEYNTGTPVATDESDVVVYEEHTFTAGTRIYVDFSAMTEGTKGVNYPKNYEVGLDYDANGAGTFKTIRFSANVTWSSLAEAFIKTEKTGWAGLKFTAPGEGQNKIVVAADGASYTWDSYTPATVQVKFFAPRDESNNWDHIYAHSWDAAGNITEWPGVEITGSKANLWYAYDVQVGANVLFHNNAGMQTANIEDIQVVACYEPTAIDYDVTPKLVTVTANAGCEIAYYIAGSQDLVGGTEDWQINLPLDNENKIVFHDVEPGTYAFKINNNSWAWSIGGIDHMKSGDCATIAQTVGEGDLGFKIDTKQDVTVTYYPETQEICLGAATVKVDGSVSVEDMTIKIGEAKQITYSKNNTETYGASYEVLSGEEYIQIYNGFVLGVKAGTATVRITIAESANYTAASDEFTITVTPSSEPSVEPIAPIGGKFLINAKGDTAIFSRGNLQYQQSSNTWRCAPNQYEWKGTDNLQMGNSAYEGWVDLFCWSIGAENNYGATSAYLTTTYFNKSFVDWGGLFSDTYEWSTLSINEWYYLLYSRANANNLWGMAMIGDNLGMIILPDEWTVPSGVTFVPGTIPTTDLFAEGDCLDPTMADQDHWRLNPDNLPANKFTVADWEILEAAGAVFLPYGGRRSGGYGNHTNRQDQTIAEEYAYAYYENYYGSYWTSTVAKPAEGKSYWLPLICGGCTDANENWGRGSHGWWENGRYGHSVRLVTRIPKVEWTEIRTGLTAGNYYTLCNAKAMTAIKGGTLWSFAGKDEQLAYIVQEDAPFEAGKPYLIYAESDKLEALLEGSDAPASDYHGLFGTLANMDNAALLAAGATHLLKNNELHSVGAGTLRAGRAYIKAGELPNGKPLNAPAHKVRSMPMQRDAAQGIEDVQGDNVQSAKVLINGNLYILRGENVYDATGRMVK